MDHIAIMSKKWNMTSMILDGSKTIESRLYKARKAPWNRIKKNDTVYFKNSGEPITLKATVSRVIQSENLNKEKIKNIFELYGEKIGLKSYEIDIWLENKTDRKYCILVFISNVEQIKPFNIDKSGFGVQSAWIAVESIDEIKA